MDEVERTELLIEEAKDLAWRLWWRYQANPTRGELYPRTRLAYLTELANARTYRRQGRIEEYRAARRTAERCRPERPHGGQEGL